MFETEPLAKVVPLTVIVKLTLLDPAESSLERFEKLLAHAKARKTNFIVSGGREQIPSSQVSPAAQACPQDPQLDELVSVFAQTPEKQVSPAAQAFPQVPQFASSV